MRILKLVVLWILAVFSSLLWSYSPTTELIHEYDAVDSYVLERNTKSESQNHTYDDPLNFHYCCSTSSTRNLQKEACEGSFFAFEVGLVATKGAGKSARTPVGRSGQQNNFPNPNAPKPRNAPETINGRDFSGHAIDRMQERGFTPSVIENALSTGTRSAGSRAGTSVFTDSANRLRVVTNSETGNVITVIPGVK